MVSHVDLRIQSFLCSSGFHTEMTTAQGTTKQNELVLLAGLGQEAPCWSRRCQWAPEALLLTWAEDSFASGRSQQGDSHSPAQ